MLLQFTPDNLNITNLLNVQNYLDLLLQLMVVFGIGFLTPGPNHLRLKPGVAIQVLREHMEALK